MEQPTYHVRSTVLGGQTITELKPDGTKGKGNVYAGGPGFADIGIGVSNYVNRDPFALSWGDRLLDRNNSVYRTINSPQEGGMMAIHELMHVALRGGRSSWPPGSDPDFARAAADLAGQEDSGLKEYPSNYWGERLNQACGFNSQITSRRTNYRLYK